MNLQESGEMYLETIYILSQKSNFVRAIDVGEYMGFSKPSVSRALSLLKNGGYVTVDGLGALSLTKEGREVAERIYERHTLISKGLVLLGVSEETAAADACKIEHDISEESFNAIKKHMKKWTDK
ncbi:MAG: metal-dependent transcriptional regulator [Acutalibacteraceae bacterium]